MGCKQGNANPYLYTRVNNGRCLCILCSIGDLAVCVKDKRDSLEIVNNSNKAVEVKHLRDIGHYLGTEIFKKTKWNLFAESETKDNRPNKVSRSQ